MQITLYNPGNLHLLRHSRDGIQCAPQQILFSCEVIFSVSDYVYVEICRGFLRFIAIGSI